tara:strand:- start:39 stop:818 length:780 start_codon:yes stop_codon:yes gene_type:complete
MEYSSLIIQPQENWNGEAIVEVIVIDENELSDTTDFIVTVLPVNDPPEEFDLIYPALTDTLPIGVETDEAYTFYWQVSEDVDSEVSYTTTVTFEYFGNVFTRTYESNDSLVSIPGYEWSELMTNFNIQRVTMEYYVTASDTQYMVESESGEFVFENTVLSIDRGLTPLSYKLHQNYPNPFNPVTTLRYDLPESSDITITIYDVMGSKVKLLLNKLEDPGYHSVIWDATNTMNQPVSAGVYLYSIETGNFRQTKKMILLK